jgi:pimeloyl-ACP methyl ester carboxylesterase
MYKRIAGLSTTPSGHTLTGTVGEHDAQSVIGAMEIKRYLVVGHSMGGKVAQLVASRQPVGLV